MGKTFNNLKCNNISKSWATIPYPTLLFTKNLFFKFLQASNHEDQ